MKTNLTRQTRKSVLTTILCGMIAVVIFVLSACETSKMNDPLMTGTTEVVETTETVGAVTTPTTARTLRPSITAPASVMTAPPYESMKLPEKDYLNIPTDFTRAMCVKYAVYSWEKHFGEELVWLDPTQSRAGVTCCGVYGGVAVFFVGADELEKTEIKVGEVSYFSKYAFELWAFKDGEFCTLETAYQNEWLTHENTMNLYAIRECLWNSVMSIYRYDYETMPKREYLKIEGNPVSTCIAIFDDSFAVFSTTIPIIPAANYEEIAGYLFQFRPYAPVEIIYEGDSYSLSKAFELGIVTEEQVAHIHEVYAPILYQTGD